MMSLTMEQRIPAGRQRFTRAEYLKLAEDSDVKLQLIDGEIVAMAGATLNHNRIFANLLNELGRQLKGSKCEAVGSDLRVLAPDGSYIYPDVVIFCDKPEFDSADPMSLVNPRVVVEVLSPTTESIDRGAKFLKYINIASLREYFLVSQNSRQVQCFYRGDSGQWMVGPTTESTDATVDFRSIGVHIKLADIYANVEFEAPATTPPADAPH